MDASKVTVDGDTAIVPSAAVHIDFASIKVLGQTVRSA